MKDLYTLFNGSHDLRKLHFWDSFSGAIPNHNWTVIHDTGSGSVSMNDAINQGLRITPGTNSGDRSCINFNNKRQYSFIGSVALFTYQAVNVDARTFAGFSDGPDIQDNDAQAGIESDDFAQTVYQLRTGTGTSQSQTSMTTALANQVIQGEVEIHGTNVTGKIGGNLEATKTSLLPLVRLQPICFCRQLPGETGVADFHYIEAYNT